ncbi:MAG TPA: bifunctional diaminohydroxyphosphoribosylaminopyrimidine deaminase/5-amino-6-(5-phosphoribosylamino)uracil reductase RibD [Aestuariivirgaceae bacterium]|nr:bifunctional diaminohydroxyphosphoribosylaminopyrimidine deaminase/5-amino-6-(5-phosphoribosylamino)uracil reductase RibD [Aestuariivirgaceae bacterium]
MDELDARWMEHALRLGRRTMGATGANPAVGCVIVAGTHLVGAGWTSVGGRPHAETHALAMAGEAARGATAYVTLEPCSHHGRTGPCADALVKAGLTRVVTSLEDPDPRVAGRGHAVLEAAGIAVETGLLADRARSDLAGYLSRNIRKRPHLVLKFAVSADGMIAETPGAPTAITGEAARNWVHAVRAQSDAILVGVSTVLADDPDLTCRLPGLEGRSPIRVISDSRASLPPDSRIARSAGTVPVWLLTLAGEARDLTGLGVELIGCAPTDDGKVDLADALGRLAGRGINSVLAEGGARMARALLEADLVDEVYLLSASKELGPGGLDALAGLPLSVITESGQFRATGEEWLGDDQLNVYERAG